MRVSGATDVFQNGRMEVLLDQKVWVIRFSQVLLQKELLLERCLCCMERRSDVWEVSNLSSKKKKVYIGLHHFNLRLSRCQCNSVEESVFQKVFLKKRTVKYPTFV